MTTNKTALSLVAHPDDTEFTCAGTLALLHSKGWEIHSATMTGGDGGSAELNRDEISRIRTAEAAKSAKILDGTYNCLWSDDVFITFDRPTRLKAIELVRKVKPSIVFAPSPSDYMSDHEITSQIVQAACFDAAVPNVETPGTEAIDSIPYLYYADAVEGKDKFGKEIKPDILVDISSVMDIKEKMLCCHESQQKWLMIQNGIDQYVISMKDFAKKRGDSIGAKYAEGFRQHLGHAYPQDNILQKELGDLVHNI